MLDSGFLSKLSRMQVGCRLPSRLAQKSYWVLPGCKSPWTLVKSFVSTVPVVTPCCCACSFWDTSKSAPKDHCPKGVHLGLQYVAVQSKHKIFKPQDATSIGSVEVWGTAILSSTSGNFMYFLSHCLRPPSRVFCWAFFPWTRDPCQDSPSL